MRRQKLVLIGAGSAVFTRRLVSDILLAGGDENWEIALVDIDEVALEAVSRLVEKIMVASGKRVPVTASINRRDVLPGADFVISTIAVGKRRAWEKDIRIPREFGIYQPVGDTTMPGGVSRGLRMIPATIAIARDIRELCPNALFVNYSNPMSAICRAVRVATDVEVVGLCHGVLHSASFLARFLGEDPDSVKVFGIGVNHLTFLTRITVNGEDAIPALHEEVRRQKAGLGVELSRKGNWPNGHPAHPRVADSPFSWEIFEKYSVFPAPMDRHVVEFHPERFASGEYYGGAKLGVNAYSFEDTIASGDAWFDDMMRRSTSNEALPESYYVNADGESEELLSILNSVLHDERKQFSVNLPNTGFAPQLPKDAVLETTASALKGGFVPLMADSLPDDLVKKLEQRLAVIELTVQAALHGDRKALTEALVLDGSVKDAAMASALADALLAAHIEHLPEFAANA